MPKIQDLIDGKARSNNSEVAGSQSLERQEVVSWIWQIFREKQTARDSSQRLFRDRTLQQYTDDNIKRFIQFKRRPAHKKPWQSNLASSSPNEKLIATISRLAAQEKELVVHSTGDYSVAEQFKEKISNSFLKSAAIKNDDDFQAILEMFEAYEKGTVIGFEDWFHGKRTIREVTNQDPETGELQFEKKTIKSWNDVRSSLIRLDEFYPGNIEVRPGHIQDMDDCFYRQVMTEDEFEATFHNFPDADLVRTQRAAKINESSPFWISDSDVSTNEVVVLYYFNKRTDEYVIVADRVWINPVGKFTVSPLPWNHKELPFWAAVFEPLDGKFFYGRSGIDKMISYSDSQDALFDRILDQMTLAASKPVITDGQVSSALTRGFLQPNNVITADWSKGKPNFDVVPIADPSPVGFTLYQMLQTKIDKSSPSSDMVAGQKGKGKSATQASQEYQAAMEIVSLFRLMMMQGKKQKIKLRFPNILQFYTMPVHSKDGAQRFKKLVLKGEELSSGKQGVLSISINPNVSQQSTEDKAKNQLQNVEFIEITPEFIRNFEYDFEIIDKDSLKMSDTQKQTLELNYQKVMLEMYQDKFNRDAGFDELNRLFNKDPEKMRAKTPAAVGDQGPGQQGAPGGQPAPGGAPQGGKAPQLMPMPA